MGCDIHIVIEYKRPSRGTLSPNDKRWDSFGFHSLTTIRNYEWFANLAGVRGDPKGGEPLMTGKGIPDDCSFATLLGCTCYVRDDGVESGNNSISRSTADKWVKDGYSKYFNDIINVNSNQPTRVTNPDYHSHGWVNVKGWKDSVRGYKDLSIQTINAIIDTYKRNDCEVRIVFWFDN